VWKTRVDAGDWDRMTTLRLVAVSAALCVAAAEFDLAAVKNC
jgi:hypothetical protein